MYFSFVDPSVCFKKIKHFNECFPTCTGMHSRKLTDLKTLEVVKTTAAAEETIGRYALGILDRSSSSAVASAGLIRRSEAEPPIKSCVHEEQTGGEFYMLLKLS